MNGNTGLFSDDSISDRDLRQQHLAEDHLQMPLVGDLDGDVNEEQNNLFFFTSITSFFTNHLFFSLGMAKRNRPCGPICDPLVKNTGWTHLFNLVTHPT